MLIPETLHSLYTRDLCSVTDSPPENTIFKMLVAVLPFLAASACAAPAATAATWWKPAVGATWNINLIGTPTKFSNNISIYDLDLFGTANSTITSLHASGHKVICYYSAGSWENWRPDAKQFPKSALGNPLDGWPGEKWLDTRDATVRRIMTDRINLAKAKGCDGVDPDNIDGYSNNPGFPLSKATATDYVNFLTTTAHNLGMASGLKNGGDIVASVVNNVDWELNEQCAQYKECGAYSAFIQAGKPVFHLEYTDAEDEDQKAVTPAFAKQSCGAPAVAKFSTLIKHLNLDTFTAICPNGQTVPF